MLIWRDPQKVVKLALFGVRKTTRLKFLEMFGEASGRVFLGKANYLMSSSSLIKFMSQLD